MNKFLILSAISFMFLPAAFATCPVDGNTVCAVPGFREQVPPVYNPAFSNINEFSGSQEARLNPLDRSDIREQSQSFAPTESNYNYNTDCQFGVCLDNRQNTIFQQKSK